MFARKLALFSEPFLYATTIEANLKVGRTTAKSQEVKQASIDACIHESIEKFPNAYQSMVGERGVTFGGQRQRVALARALKAPPILILDDALSAVDTDTEFQILTSQTQAAEPNNHHNRSSFIERHACRQIRC